MKRLLVCHCDAPLVCNSASVCLVGPQSSTVSWSHLTLTSNAHTRGTSSHTLGLMQVDCTLEQQLCKDHFVTAFPSIRVFRKAHDEVNVSVSPAAGDV